MYLPLFFVSIGYLRGVSEETRSKSYSFFFFYNTGKLPGVLEEMRNQLFRKYFAGTGHLLEVDSDATSSHRTISDW